MDILLVSNRDKEFKKSQSRPAQHDQYPTNQQ